MQEREDGGFSDSVVQLYAYIRITKYRYECIAVCIIHVLQLPLYAFERKTAIPDSISVTRARLLGTAV